MTWYVLTTSADWTWQDCAVLAAGTAVIVGITVIGVWWDNRHEG